MKYLTKEWYELYKQSTLSDFFHANKYAAQFDEALFQKLYKNREKKWVTAVRSTSFGSDEEQYEKMLEKVQRCIDRAITEEIKKKLETFREDYIAFHKMGIESGEQCEAIDDESARRAYAGYYAETLKTIETFPQELLEKVADKRMLAIGYATKENKKLLIDFARKQGKKADLLWKKALEAVDEVESRMPRPLGLNEFPSGVMDGIKKTKSGLLLKFDDICDVRVINGVIIQQEYPVYKCTINTQPLAPATFMIGKELEYVDGKYRLSLFLENVGRYEDVTPWELVVEGDDIKVSE